MVETRRRTGASPSKPVKVVAEDSDAEDDDTDEDEYRDEQEGSDEEFVEGSSTSKSTFTYLYLGTLLSMACCSERKRSAKASESTLGRGRAKGDAKSKRTSKPSTEGTASAKKTSGKRRKTLSSIKELPLDMLYEVHDIATAHEPLYHMPHIVLCLTRLIPFHRFLGTSLLKTS